VAVHEVFATFCRSERDRITGFLDHLEARGALPETEANALRTAVEHPDAESPLLHHLRMRAVYVLRAPLLGEIPPDTRWYAVSHLEREHLGELLVISRCGWDKPSHGNELDAVAACEAVEAGPVHPENWDRRLILWAHSRRGPFTILEGNHRLVALRAASTIPPLHVEVLVGLSPSPCLLHRQDAARPLLYGLWNPALFPQGPYSLP
jgi:hypothetical protein